MSNEHPPTPAPAHEHPPTPPVSSGAPEHPPRAYHPESGTAERAAEVRSALNAEAGADGHHSEEDRHGEHSHGDHTPHTETRTTKEALKNMWKGRGGLLWGAGKALTLLGGLFAWLRSTDLLKIDHVSGDKGGGGGGGGGHKEDHGHGGGAHH